MAMANLPRNSFRRNPGKGEDIFRGEKLVGEAGSSHQIGETGGVLMRMWGSVGGGNHRKLRAALLCLEVRCLPPKAFPIQQDVKVTHS